MIGSLACSVAALVRTRPITARPTKLEFTAGMPTLDNSGIVRLGWKITDPPSETYTYETWYLINGVATSMRTAIGSATFVDTFSGLSASTNYLFEVRVRITSTGQYAATVKTAATVNYTANTSGGRYSCTLVNASYQGPVMRLRTDQGSTSARDDFYAASSSTSILRNSAGRTVSEWLTSLSLSTASNVMVDTWYDQSLTGNHAYQSTLTSQPVYKPINRNIDFSGSKFFTLRWSSEATGLPQ